MKKSPRTAQWLPAGINHLFMSGKRDSNPRPSAWEADALPTELLPRSECKYTKSAELSSSFGQFLFSPSDIDDKRTGASVLYRKPGRTDTAYRKKRPSTTCGRPSPSDTLSGYPQQPDTVRETECKTGVSPTPVHCSAVGRSLRKTHGDTTVYGPLRCGRIGRHRRELFSEALGTDTVCRNPVLHEYRFDILRPFFGNFVIHRPSTRLIRKTAYPNPDIRDSFSVSPQLLSSCSIEFPARAVSLSCMKSILSNCIQFLLSSSFVAFRYASDWRYFSMQSSHPPRPPGWFCHRAICVPRKSVPPSQQQSVPPEQSERRSHFQ